MRFSLHCNEQNDSENVVDGDTEEDFDEYMDEEVEESCGLEGDDENDSENVLDDGDAIEQNVEGSELRNYGLILGNQFEDMQSLRDAILDYSLKEKKDIKWNRSEKNKLSAVCNYEGCPWRLYASREAASGKIVIKTLQEQHKCIHTEKNKLFKTPKIVSLFLDTFRENPAISTVEMRAHVLATYNVRVSLPQCRAAKNRCRMIIQKEHETQFERLWDYVVELKRSNPGSNIILEIDGNIFYRMYVCFHALKQGWLTGCRSVIHLDGAFLKWHLKGELLADVGRDANDQLFPIAWAIVQVENQSNWSWFIENIRDDLSLGLGEGLTLMTDQQKGLLNAIAKHLPVAEHRMCARHICSNLKKKCNDDQVRLYFWKVAKCYTEAEFHNCMDELKDVSVMAYNELLKNDPRHWCRAFFSTICKCDVVDNNFSESFNATIRTARTKPVVKMLEEIRQGVMVSMGKKASDAEQHRDPISPKAQELVDREKKIAYQCALLKNGRGKYEVGYKGQNYAVDLSGHVSCSCQRREISGIPCCHLIAALWDDFRGTANVEDLVDSCWTTNSWKMCYAILIQPVNGSQLWEKTTDIKVAPPPDRKMPGRPKKNDRKKDPHESPKKKGKLSRHGMHMTCQHCLSVGHNSCTCPNKYNPPVARDDEKRPRGRPRKHPISSNLDKGETSGTKRTRKRKTQGPKAGEQGSQQSIQEGYGVYVSPLTGDTYIHAGSRVMDTRDNVVFPTQLQRERDLLKLKKSRDFGANSLLEDI